MPLLAEHEIAHSLGRSSATVLPGQVNGMGCASTRTLTLSPAESSRAPPKLRSAQRSWLCRRHFMRCRRSTAHAVGASIFVITIPALHSRPRGKTGNSIKATAHRESQAIHAHGYPCLDHAHGGPAPGRLSAVSLGTTCSHPSPTGVARGPAAPTPAGRCS